jgi:hypothetical protein
MEYTRNYAVLQKFRKHNPGPLNPKAYKQHVAGATGLHASGEIRNMEISF